MPLTAASPAAPVVEEDTFEVTLPDEEVVVTPDDTLEEDVTDKRSDPSAEAVPHAVPSDATPPPTVTVPVEPKTEIKAEAALVPTSPAETSPPVEPKRLDPIAREERTKRKEYARLYAEAKDQLDAAERRIRLLTAHPTDPKDPNLKKWYDELEADASKATDLADVLRLAVKEMDRRDTARVRELNANLYQVQCDLSELRARHAHPDWERVVRQAGMFEAITADAQGQFRDPAIARRVYYHADGTLAADPAERMYRLAVGKLEYERGQPDLPDEDLSPTDRSEKAATVEAKTQVQREHVEAEAERRGAQRVIEQVTKNSTRPKSIRTLPTAGPGPQRVSRQYLDELMQSNPLAYERLVAQQPDLERWHLG